MKIEKHNQFHAQRRYVDQVKDVIFFSDLRRRKGQRVHPVLIQAVSLKKKILTLTGGQEVLYTLKNKECKFYKKLNYNISCISFLAKYAWTRENFRSAFDQN